MNAIAVREDGVPLGICRRTWRSRSEKAERRSGKSKRTEDKETPHWGNVMQGVREKFTEPERFLGFNSTAVAMFGPCSPTRRVGSGGRRLSAELSRGTHRVPPVCVLDGHTPIRSHRHRQKPVVDRPMMGATDHDQFSEVVRPTLDPRLAVVNVHPHSIATVRDFALPTRSVQNLPA